MHVIQYTVMSIWRIYDCSLLWLSYLLISPLNVHLFCHCLWFKTVTTYGKSVEFLLFSLWVKKYSQGRIYQNLPFLLDEIAISWVTICIGYLWASEMVVLMSLYLESVSSDILWLPSTEVSIYHYYHSRLVSSHLYSVYLYFSTYFTKVKSMIVCILHFH